MRYLVTSSQFFPEYCTINELYNKMCIDFYGVQIINYQYFSKFAFKLNVKKFCKISTNRKCKSYTDLIFLTLYNNIHDTNDYEYILDLKDKAEKNELRDTIVDAHQYCFITLWKPIKNQKSSIYQEGVYLLDSRWYYFNLWSRTDHLYTPNFLKNLNTPYR